jgi:Arc/MetJ-type ribon-helix-helix transcriptional regulator
MSKQVTVRLPDDLVRFMDERVEHGQASGRAAVVAAALERERRRQQAERDVAILMSAERADGDDLDSLATHAAQLPLDHLD